MYELSGDFTNQYFNYADPTTSSYVGLVSTKFYYFKIVPPASPYIIIPPGGIIIYELAGGNIFKTRNVVDPM
jgi:hypothetical protein